MKLKLHRQIAANTKLFLDYLGYKSVWNKIDANFDELVILTPTNKLLTAVEKELTKSGHIPYHYSLKYTSVGEYVKGEELESGVVKIGFTGEVKEVRTLENISGSFHLIRYESEEGNNFINKRYKLENDILVGQVQVFCRPVAQLVGLNQEKINLVNWARVKQI